MQLKPQKEGYFCNFGIWLRHMKTENTQAYATLWAVGVGTNLVHIVANVSHIIVILFYKETVTLYQWIGTVPVAVKERVRGY